MSEPAWIDYIANAPVAAVIADVVYFGGLVAISRLKRLLSL